MPGLYNTSATGLYINNGNGVFTDSGLVIDPPRAYGADWGDYDNDGDLDLIINGGDSSYNSVTKIYRNDGSGIMTDTGMALGPIGGGTAAWGDYDNDGYLDLILTGNQSIANSSRGGLTYIYRNTGTGSFTKTATLASLESGGAAWGDYDNDGDLDVLVNGYTAEYSPPPSSIILYRNDNGSFNQVNVGLPNAVGKAEWADYDNDGDLDLLLTGLQNSSPTTRVFRNDGGTFTDISTNLSGSFYGPASGWGDYDNDGDLDLLLSGTNGPIIYQNRTDFHNSPPTAPTNLSVTQSGGLVTLSWSPGMDQQTLTQSLTYDIRVGTYPGGGNIAMPPADLVTGYRRIAHPGYLGQGTFAILKGLDQGRTYYWSVQSVDGALAGSPFSEEGSFTTPMPGINFTSSTMSVSEGAGYAVLPVVLSATPSHQVSVAYTTTSGTALAGSDFTATSGTLIFAIGQKNASINIPIIDDALPGYEGDETFQVALSNPTYATLGSTSVETVTIQDNEPMPSLYFPDAGIAISEGAGSTPVTVNLSGPAYVPVTVDYKLSGQTATPGQDYQDASGQIVFAPGETSQTVLVTPIDDTIDEPTETFLLILSNPHNAVLQQVSQTISILDNDDPPQINLGSSTLAVSEDQGTAQLTVSLSSASSYPVTIDYSTSGGTALSGIDFVPLTGTLTFKPGETTHSVEVSLLTDKYVENEETFSFSIANPTNALLGQTSTTQITIKDSPPLLVSFSQSAITVSESDGMVSVVVRLSAKAAVPVTVQYHSSDISATAGSDYEALSGTLTFSPGTDIQIIQLKVFTDDLVEGPETFGILLTDTQSALLGEPNTLLVTILDTSTAPPTQTPTLTSTPTPTQTPTDTPTPIPTPSQPKIYLPLLRTD